MCHEALLLLFTCVRSTGSVLTALSTDLQLPDLINAAPSSTGVEGRLTKVGRGKFRVRFRDSAVKVQNGVGEKASAVS